MTYNELLHSVSFEDIDPYIGKYGHREGISLYKTHYDMLKLLEPSEGDDDEKTVTVSNAELEFDFEEPHLDAYPIEGCLWEEALSKEIIVEPDVQATWAEIAARLLWHTSFYGFTPEQQHECFERLDFYGQNLLDPAITRIRAKRIQKKIEELGGDIPSKKEMMTVPAFKHEVNLRVNRMLHLPIRNKKRRLARRVVDSLYWERILEIGTVICDCLHFEDYDPSLDCGELRKAFFANKYQTYRYKSFAAEGEVRGKWLFELITKYNAFYHGMFPKIILSTISSHEHPTTIDDIEYLFKDLSLWFNDNIQNSNITWGSWGGNYDDTLGDQLCLSVIFYE